jgi:hypothetical protein
MMRKPEPGRSGVANVMGRMMIAPSFVFVCEGCSAGRDVISFASWLPSENVDKALVSLDPLARAKRPRAFTFSGGGEKLGSKDQEDGRNPFSEKRLNERRECDRGTPDQPSIELLN